MKKIPCILALLLCLSFLMGASAEKEFYRLPSSLFSQAPYSAPEDEELPLEKYLGTWEYHEIPNRTAYLQIDRVVKDSLIFSVKLFGTSQYFDLTAVLREDGKAYFNAGEGHRFSGALVFHDDGITLELDPAEDYFLNQSTGESISTEEYFGALSFPFTERSSGTAVYYRSWQEAYERFLSIGTENSLPALYIENSPFYSDLADRPLSAALYDLDGNKTPELLLFNGTDRISLSAVYVFGYFGGGCNFIEAVPTVLYPTEKGLIGMNETFQRSFELCTLSKETLLSRELIKTTELPPSETVTFLTENQALSALLKEPLSPLPFYTLQEISLMGFDVFASHYKSAAPKESGKFALTLGAELFSAEPSFFSADLAKAAGILCLAADHGETDALLSELGCASTTYWYHLEAGEPDASVTFGIRDNAAVMVLSGTDQAPSALYTDPSYLNEKADEVISSLHTWLSDLPERKKGLPLFITGFGIDGALAYTVAERIEDFSDVYVYTVAAPSVFEKEKGFGFNLVFEEDLLPQLPFAPSSGGTLRLLAGNGSSPADYAENIYAENFAQETKDLVLLTLQNADPSGDPYRISAEEQELLFYSGGDPITFTARGACSYELTSFKNGGEILYQEKSEQISLKEGDTCRIEFSDGRPKVFLLNDLGKATARIFPFGLVLPRLAIPTLIAALLLAAGIFLFLRLSRRN